MNNVEISAMREFRRFINTYIYPDTSSILIGKIQTECATDYISYELIPQAVVKFHSASVDSNNNLSVYTHAIHDKLNSIFISHFNDQLVSSLIKSRIHTEIQDEDLKNLLRATLQEIQNANPRYIGLLFNITILKDYMSYLYL